MPDRTFDIAIVGGGIVGLAVGRELSRRFPGQRLAVVEKEPEVGAHQTSHNSGVIHSGLYYRPGSFKARFCVAGAEAMKRYCHEHDLPYEVCGKVVVATNDKEAGLLQNLYHPVWAGHFMLHVRVDDAAAWARHAQAVIASGEYPGAKVEGPREESWGFRVSYVWDPSGVLLHFAEAIPRAL